MAARVNTKIVNVEKYTVWYGWVSSGALAKKEIENKIIALPVMYAAP